MGEAKAKATSIEGELLLRVLSALLREDVVGWRTQSETVRLPDGLWLRLPVAPGRGASAEGNGAGIPAPRPGADTGGSDEGSLPHTSGGASTQEEAASSDAAHRRPVDNSGSHGREQPARTPAGATPRGSAERDAVAIPAPRPGADVRGGGTQTEAGGRSDRAVRRPGGDALLMPVRADGYQAAYAARLPFIRRESDGRELRDAGSVLSALRGLAAPVDRGGFDAFAVECAQALDAMRLHDRTRGEVGALLTGRYGEDPAAWRGLGGGLGFDTLAARADHPVYPTSRGRSGLDVTQLRSYAPEFHPTFALRWLALPRDAVTVGGGSTAWLSPRAAGVPELDGSHLLLPVHPLTADGPLRDALRAAGLHERARLITGPGPDVVPTLSMRTVALASDPAQHLKLPLATATLGLRNRRTIKPGTLTDGAAGQRLVEAVIGREPRFQGVVLHADETRFAHAGHELLAVLLRRYPAGLDGAVVVPMAALMCPAPGGDRLLVDHLADRFYGGDPLALLDATLTLLFDWQTTLFAYGVALESHQQNISLVLENGDEGAGRAARLRLLFKDNDGPRVNLARLRDAMGQQAPSPDEFDDSRIFVDGDRPVLDLFTTITLHLCAGSYAFGLARHGHAPLERLLRLVRERLAEAVERLDPGPGEPGALLRAHVLDAAELPVKAMVTAGTLLSKERSGAADINKHYTTGPNYLRMTGSS
ncbi:IucA/IucC family siderophore biosynthesis protein [Streptomyces sp. NBC_01283]|nr:IucA/IucC family siderophore biosynthesis protein [Streptomyces sp. NBC_01283]